MEKEIRWLGPYKPTDRHADDVTMQELVRLRVENERLREALKDIADYQKHGWIDGITDIARAALKGGE